jgi:hypothetical protein
LVPFKEARHKALCLLYHYRHLDGIDLTDLPLTDLITHRVTLKPGTKPANNSKQRRWPAHTEWWMRKIVTDGIKGGVYELVEPANGWLSPWNARAVIVDKVENPTPQDEPRVTFDYFRVHEELPGSFLELFSKVHDNLSDPRHKVFFSADLKHAYLIISMHSDDRHYFAFFISGIGQVQPTRVQQGSKSAGFIMTELVYRAFGPLPPSIGEPSLLHSADPFHLPVLVFYMDDFFGGFQSFDDLYEFLRDHFLSRIEWAKLRLFFKKMHLFEDKVKALGVTHCVGGFIKILEDRIKKITKWSVLTDQIGVRAFMGAVGIIRRWIRNFAELARPLARLTGKVDWRWTDSEQLSFEIIRVKATIKSAMHGINLNDEVHFYTDASAYAAGMAVTQFRIENGKFVEVSIMYDSFLFPSSRRKYSVYKRELYAIVIFVIKYDYLCKHFYKPAIIHTDHRPLTHFLESDAHEGIYGHWADQLRRLNIVIKYIPGPRNKVADALSRTLFFDEDCRGDITIVVDALKELKAKGPDWVWKDGKGGFEEFLASVPLHRSEVIERGTMSGVPVFTLDAVPLRSMEKSLSSEIAKPGVPRRGPFKEAPEFIEEENTWKFAYETSIWFGDIYFFLKGQRQGATASLMRRSFDYRLVDDILWIHRGDFYLPCIPEKKVLDVLRDAHDNSGHWAKAGTIAKIHGTCYWPGMTLDVERYIAGCLECAKHGPARRSQPLHPVLTTYPFQLIGMDFIGPLAETKPAKHTHILNIVCYFSRFMVPFACRSANVEDVTWSLRLFVSMYRTPHAIYCDRGQHFDNEVLRDFLRSYGIAIDYSPSGASKSTGMVEMSNRLLEEVLRKAGPNPDSDTTWDLRLAKATKAVNERVIPYLGISPSAINFGRVQETSSVNSTILRLPGRNIRAWHDELVTPAIHCNHVRTYLNHRAEIHDTVQTITTRQRENEAARYNRGISRATHHPNDLVMLYQKKTGKLEPRWRGPFRISGYGGSHGISFTLVQLNGRKIRGSFHGDHLKTFTPRTGYLLPGGPLMDILPQQQTIRKTRVRKR